MQLLTIVFVLSVLSYILSPSIEGCSTVRAVEMDREILVAVVPKPYNCLSSLLHEEGRARRHGIVSDKLSGLQPRVDLLGEWTDIDLVVIDSVARGRICVGVFRCLFCRDRKRVLEYLLVLGAKPLAIASQSF